MCQSLVALVFGHKTEKESRLSADLFAAVHSNIKYHTILIQTHTVIPISHIRIGNYISVSSDYRTCQLQVMKIVSGQWRIQNE